MNRLEELRQKALNLNPTLKCDLGSRIDRAKSGSTVQVAISKQEKSPQPVGVVWKENFTDHKKFPKLKDFIKVGWFAIIPHGKRERYCEIVSVGLRRITVKRSAIVNGKQQIIYATLKAHKISGVVKNE